MKLVCYCETLRLSECTRRHVSLLCIQHRKCEVLESGSWGRRIRLFYHNFYGEGIELEPGAEVSPRCSR